MLQTNKPSLERLQRQLKHTSVAYGTATATAADLLTLDELLTASIADVELKTSMFFDARKLPTEVRDGNGTDAIQTLWGPIGHVFDVRVELPVLALIRIYTTSELKVYAAGRRIRVFTYKLAAEHASLRLDSQVYSQLLPALPQCVFITYAAGLPLYDPDQDITSLDGSSGAPDEITRLAGDVRNPRFVIWQQLMGKAAVFDAAATYLATIARNQVGIAGSVSFDGYSKGLNPQAFGPAVEQLVQDRDAALAPLRAFGGMMMSTSA